MIIRKRNSKKSKNQTKKRKMIKVIKGRKRRNSKMIDQSINRSYLIRTIIRGQRIS